MANTFAVDFDRIAIVVMTNDRIERITFRTKRQADKKIVELCAVGYTFDREWWYRQRQRQARLHIEAHNLCNTLCDKLYNWNPEPERAQRLAQVLSKARARLARRERN